MEGGQQQAFQQISSTSRIGSGSLSEDLKVIQRRRELLQQAIDAIDEAMVRLERIYQKATEEHLERVKRLEVENALNVNNWRERRNRRRGRALGETRRNPRVPNPVNPGPKPFSAAAEQQALKYLTELENRYSAACNRQILTRWDYITNVTKDTEHASVDAETVYLNFKASIQKEIFARFPNWRDFKDESIRRQFKYLSILGPATMPAADVAKMTQLASDMESDYVTVGVCEYENPSNCTLRLDPELEKILKTETDPKKLAHYWTAWHDKMSEKVPPAKYQQFLSYQLTMAKANGFKDMSEMWMVFYDDETPEYNAASFKQQVFDIWEDLRPMYEKLHAYVRMKLRKRPEYKDIISKCGYIPAYATGNMWAQEWTRLDSITKPFPDAPSLDATEAMIKKNYTVLKMFQESDKFFTGLGLLPMTGSFWNKSMLQRPDDGREVVCHASAEDFCLGKDSQDFRIKQCTKVNMEQLITVHHEMGHIEYFQQYTNLPFVFRDGANPGFHEAIGDALALAVVTPKHLQCNLELELGLDSSICDETPIKRAPGSVTETDVNFLYMTALKKLAFYPFAISMDSWRWEAFEGKLSPNQYNKRWWELRMKNQGIQPPTDRMQPNLFDAAAKYHIVTNVEYLRYFISNILQFQFYEAMCIAAGQYDPNSNTSKPLYQCDFSGSQEAGQRLGSMLKLGSSKGWPEALEAITGNRTMSTSSLKKYLQPLLDHMDKELDENGEVPGFGESCEEVAKNYLENVYERKASALAEQSALGEWAYVTNLKNTTARDHSEELNLAVATFDKDQWKHIIRHFDVESITDPLLKRQLQTLNVIGAAALPEDKLKRYNKISTEMTEIYGTGKICPFKNQECDVEKEGLDLNPGIENVLTQSRDYDELAYTWKAWRDATGKKIRPLYNEYVDLGNEAAKLNGFKSLKEMWWRRYESGTFQEDCQTLWLQVKPVYEELHGYVRYKLRSIYPQIGENDPIPAQLFGNMWSQSWEHLNSIMIPFPNASRFDVTDALKERYTPDLKGITGMFEAANEFFMSLGLSDMSVSFGPNAQLIRPKDREVVCHASAWDFSNKKDFRVKMCTKVNQEDFVTIHHELGHIQYYLNYKNLPVTFRTGANPGFHEAIGDVLALSVSTPRHMAKIGLAASQDKISEESTVNYLMQVGLEKIAFLPFGFLLDSYRWKMYDGSIERDKLTYNWLKMRNEYQGIVPPVERSEEDFDPGAKYHVPGDTPYIRYFVSHILQFQIYRSLCQTAGEYPAHPLHECDFYQNKESGAQLKKLLEAGSSKHWAITLNETIGTDKMDASAIKEYFAPLLKYLQDFRAKTNYPIGWSNNAFEKLVKQKV